MSQEPNPLADYWQKRYRCLQDEPTHDLIRSLRSQLTTIKRLAHDARRDSEGQTEALASIEVHARIALEVEMKAPVQTPEPDHEADIRLFG